MLYTRKGDNGSTKIFGCNQSLSKSSIIAEALGSLDEANSFLGIIRAKLTEENIVSDLLQESDLIQKIQENLFIIQAEVAGSDMAINEKKIIETEDLIADIEKEIPPITSFIIPGSSIKSAEMDFARTLIRQAERRVVSVSEEKIVKISANTLAYLNRLSSLLYALARLFAYKSGINESTPDYK